MLEYLDDVLPLFPAGLTHHDRRRRARTFLGETGAHVVDGRPERALQVLLVGDVVLGVLLG